MKEKLEYIKRYKFPLILIFLIMIVSIIFALCLKAEKSKRDNAMFLEEQKRLSDMSSYLNEVDEIVTSNTEKLEEITLSSTSTGDTLNSLEENLLLLNESISVIEANITKYMKTASTENEAIITALSSLSDSQQEIKEQITNVSQSITSNVEELRTAGEQNFSKTSEKLNELDKSLEELDKNTESYYKDITDLIAAMQTENQTEHKELLNALIASSDNISSLINEKSHSLQLKMDEDFSILLEKHNILHEQIIQTKANITNLLSLMEENAASRQQEIKAAFTSIATSLEAIKNDYTEAHTEIQNLITKLQETEIANHEETLSTLTMLENNMEENAIQNLTHITNSLQTLEERFDTSISSMQTEMSQNFHTLNTEFMNNLSQQSNSITEQFNQLNNNVVNHYESLSTTINNNESNQQSSLEDFKNMLISKLNEVFTYVSNGKKNLVSALLTKNISIKEDASFEEIKQAILSIPQKIVIGVEETPGNISYEYHYHVNSTGQTPHTEQTSENGGCYTSPVYHTHTGSYKNGGGCYTVPLNHSHTSNCYTVTKHETKVISYWFTGKGTGHPCCSDAHGQNMALYKYTDNIYQDGKLISSQTYERELGYSCGLCIARKATEKNAVSTISTIICGYSEGLNGYELGCGKTTDTVIAYIPGCGFADGQIIGAHIVYNQDSIAKTSAADVERSEESFEAQGEPDEMEVVFEISEETVSGNTSVAE